MSQTVLVVTVFAVHCVLLCIQCVQLRQFNARSC